MNSPKLPAIQGRRFDVETLQHNAASLARHADQGPTYLRLHGQIAYVVLTVEIFDQVWPDQRRAWAVSEIAASDLAMLLEASGKSEENDEPG